MKLPRHTTHLLPKALAPEKFPAGLCLAKEGLGLGIPAESL
jgi:hypothetical protein